MTIAVPTGGLSQFVDGAIAWAEVAAHRTAREPPRAKERTAMKPKSAVPGYLVAGVGLALIAVGLYWGVVIGYTSGELPVLLGLLGGGALIAWLGQRMLEAAKHDKIERRIAERDAQSEERNGNH